MNTATEIELIVGPNELPRSDETYGYPTDLWRYFATEHDVARFARFLVQYAVAQSEIDAQNNHPYPICRHRKNLINIDFNFLLLAMSKWVGNSRVFMDFAVGQKEQKPDDFKGFANNDRSFVLLAYLSLVLPFLSSQTLYKSGQKAYHYHPVIYRRNGVDCEFRLVSIRRQKLIEMASDQGVFLTRFLEFCDDGSMELIAGGSAACKAHWQERRRVVYA